MILKSVVRITNRTTHPGEFHLRQFACLAGKKGVLRTIEIPTPEFAAQTAQARRPSDSQANLAAVEFSIKRIAQDPDQEKIVSGSRRSQLVYRSGSAYYLGNYLYLPATQAVLTDTPHAGPLGEQFLAELILLLK